MIDHLIRFDTEADAQADPIVGMYWVAETDLAPASWRDDTCIPDVAVYTVAADGSRQVFPGWFIVIARPAVDLALRGLAADACRLIADRDAAARGDPNFLLYLAPDIDPSTVATARVEPSFAGSNYPFGTG